MTVANPKKKQPIKIGPHGQIENENDQYGGWMGNEEGKLQDFNTVPFPDWIPQDVEKLYGTAADYDKRFYTASDNDFKQRHGGVALAEKLFEAKVLADQQGDSTLSPAIQNAFVTAGLEGSLAAFGDSPGVLKSGSAGEAAVGRHLGQNILQFQDRNRQNAERSLLIAENIFPHRTIGFGGETAAQIEASNVANQNEYNFSRYSDTVGKDLFNWRIDASNLTSAVNQENVETQAGASKDAAKKQQTAAMVGAGVAVLAVVAIAF